MKTLEELFAENSIDTGYLYIDKIITEPRFLKIVEERELDILLDFQNWYNINCSTTPDNGIDTFYIEQYIQERKDGKP